MKRVVVDHYGGPEVLELVEEEDPRPGQGEVLVKVLAAGVSFTDAQLRAGTYLPGAPKPPFTPGYELVGVVEALGPGCSRLHEGDRIGALTVWARTPVGSACRKPARSKGPRTSIRGR